MIISTIFRNRTTQKILRVVVPLAFWLGAWQLAAIWVDTVYTYRFGRWKTLRLVYVPSVLPYFASGCATGLGLAWKAGVAAEVLCQPRLAIGTQVYRAKITLETPDLFAWTAVVIALSFLLEYALGLLFRRLGRGAKV